eukprot:5704091-Amphidinium_carterae.2
MAVNSARLAFQPSPIDLTQDKQSIAMQPEPLSQVSSDMRFAEHRQHGRDARAFTIAPRQAFTSVHISSNAINNEQKRRDKAARTTLTNQMQHKKAHTHKATKRNARDQEKASKDCQNFAGKRDLTRVHKPNQSSQNDSQRQNPTQKKKDGLGPHKPTKRRDRASNAGKAHKQHPKGKLYHN